MKKVISAILCAVLSLTAIFALDSTCAKAEESNGAKSYVTISFAGDCALGTYEGGKNRFGSFWSQYTPEMFLSGVTRAFATDDITFVNLEGPLTNQIQVKEKEFSVKGEPKYISILTTGSVEAVALANNHTGDCGDLGLKETKQILAKNNIAYAIYNDIALVEKKGIVVAFLSYGCWAPKQYWANIDRDVAKCKQIADVVCVSFHGGDEGKHKTTDYQRQTCRHAADVGADIVVMEHAHIVQGLEYYNNVPIVYGLGNFCFGLATNPKDKDTFIFQADVAKDGTVLDTRVIPCKISSTDTTNDYIPTIQPLEESVRIVEKLRKISNEFGATNYFNFGEYQVYDDTVCYHLGLANLIPNLGNL